MNQLKKTGGLIAEFVNPKYKDESKTAFQKSTRLECMMQDYPKTLPSDARVGFTAINQVHPHRSAIHRMRWLRFGRRTLQSRIQYLRL